MPVYTFPLTLAQFFDVLPIGSVRFEPTENIEISETTDGVLLAADIRERMFILAHADLQERGESVCGATDAGTGADLSQRSEPDGNPDRAAQCSSDLEPDVGSYDLGRLGPAKPGLFPPMPGRFAEWGEALGRSPELKPSVHRLDDGLASWLDRTAAAGNGVVPLAAARAWRYLRAELMAV